MLRYISGIFVIFTIISIIIIIIIIIITIIIRIVTDVEVAIGNCFLEVKVIKEGHIDRYERIFMKAIMSSEGNIAI